MLKWTDIWGVEHDRVKESIELLKQFEPPEGYYLAFSGGKDSVVIYDLAVRAGVKFDAHYNLTTVDPPELVWFIKKEYPEVAIDRPSKTMWQLIKHKGFLPSRWIRYCCSELKERGGEGRIIITGVRRGESVKRSKRKEFEECYKKKEKYYLNPIIEWSTKDVWEYIHTNNVPHCKLYDFPYNFKRIGCIMCPLSSNLKREMELYPKIANIYYKTAKSVYNANKMDTHKTFESYWLWWINGCNGEKKNEGQQYFFE